MGDTTLVTIKEAKRGCHIGDTIMGMPHWGCNIGDAIMGMPHWGGHNGDAILGMPAVACLCTLLPFYVPLLPQMLAWLRKLPCLAPSQMRIANRGSSKWNLRLFIQQASNSAQVPVVGLQIRTKLCMHTKTLYEALLSCLVGLMKLWPCITRKAF